MQENIELELHKIVIIFFKLLKYSENSERGILRSDIPDMGSRSSDFCILNEISQLSFSIHM